MIGKTERKTIFKTNYEVETQIEDIIKRDIRFLVLAGIFIVVMLIAIPNLDGIDTLGYISIAIIVVLGIWTILGLSKMMKVGANLGKSYYEIKDTYVCGYAFSNIEEADNGAYFEVPYADIRAVRHAVSSVAGKLYYTFFIDHKGGTYKLCIDDSRDAAKVTEEKMKEVQQ